MSSAFVGRERPPTRIWRTGMREIVGSSARSESFLPSRCRTSPPESFAPEAAAFGSGGDVSSFAAAGQGASASSASSPAGAQSVCDFVHTSVVRRSFPSAIMPRRASFSTGPRRSSPTA